VSRGGDAAHVLHLGGVSKHLTRVLIVRDAGKAVHLRAANAVVRGHCHEKEGVKGVYNHGFSQMYDITRFCMPLEICALYLQVA